MTQENRAESTGCSRGTGRIIVQNALHEGAVVEETVAPVQVVQAQEPWEGWPCAGPGCNARMRHKSEWRKYYSHYYCHPCYNLL